MAQVLIRKLDDSVLRSLKERAAAEGKSLEQLLRESSAGRPGWR
jgi:plasmid stability protein